MSTVAKVAASHAEILRSMGHVGEPVSRFARKRWRVMGGLLFLFLVIGGSVWTVFNVQYLDDLESTAVSPIVAEMPAPQAGMAAR